MCVFAYGQTGSGKTWTMTGGKGDQRGLTPRVIEEIFGNIEKAQGALEVGASSGIFRRGFMSYKGNRRLVYAYVFKGAFTTPLSFINESVPVPKP